MAEISYYPFTKDEYKEIIGRVVEQFSSFDLECEYTPMSTIVKGEHAEILKMMAEIIQHNFSKNPSILNVKLSNACF